MTSVEQQTSRRGDHVCARCNSVESMIAVAAPFLARGVTAGAMSLLVVPDPVSVGPLLHSPSWPREVVVVGFEAVYPQSGGSDGTVVAGAPIDTDALLHGWRFRLDQALAAGYTGLCVAADATPLVRTAEQRAAFHRYESLVGRLIASHPISALCLYHGHDVSDQDFADTASVHPETHPESAPSSTTFRLWFSQPDVLSVSGDMDADDQARLERVLHSYQGVATPSLTVDATALRFITHNALIALDRWASTAGRPVEIRGMSSTIRRVATLLRIGHLRLVPGSR